MAVNPSLGIDRETGKTLTGWDHVLQSLQDIFVTPIGARIMREWYGSLVPKALGRNITREEILPVMSSITAAIEQWEPRFAVTSIDISGEPRLGNLSFTIYGKYRPRALLGDLTEAGGKMVSFASSEGAVSIN